MVTAEVEVTATVLPVSQKNHTLNLFFTDHKKEY